jgi:hypothetical protein
MFRLQCGFRFFSWPTAYYIFIIIYIVITTISLPSFIIVAFCLFFPCFF